jgi:hypothetical protein
MGVRIVNRADRFPTTDPFKTGESLVKKLLLLFASLVCLLVLFSGVADAQARPANFQGRWKWAIYATSRDELPPAYRDAPLREIPAASVYLNLKQRGKKLTGECDASRHFLARLEEESEVDAVVNGNTVELELESGFGGKITVRLTLSGNRIHWKTIKAEGEYYFPDDVYLKRVVKKGRR